MIAHLVVTHIVGSLRLIDRIRHRNTECLWSDHVLKHQLVIGEALHTEGESNEHCHTEMERVRNSITQSGREQGTLSHRVGESKEHYHTEWERVRNTITQSGRE